jgi:hypothetical protein
VPGSLLVQLSYREKIFEPWGKAFACRPECTIIFLEERKSGPTIVLGIDMLHVAVEN